ncbi:hypothetical protein C8F04DRAFT_1232197 [Mycena alexandri]|uniref:Uncharacterized protein n=1 Tax=Mycena alexandri TaxID=1745969 RepID=A0AAD6T5U1_9AGAR|nr:hypothetical protein C8F04DRAFT_1232197 [Mycena alexandri]
MPEGNEISFLRKYLLDFFPRLQKWLSKEALNRPLELVKIWTDVRGMEVWSKFPPDIQAQLSNKHDNWETFIAALCSLPLTSTILLQSVARVLNLGTRDTAQLTGFNRSLPSECKLAVALTQYCPPTWRGKDPDPNRVVPDPHLVLEGSTEKEIFAAVARCTKYYDFLCLQSTKLHESLSDLIEKRGWDDKPPTCIKKLLAQAPEEVWRVLTECAELKLGLAERLSKAINTAALKLQSLTLELSKRKSLQNLRHLWSLVEHILPPLISELWQLAASLPKEPVPVVRLEADMESASEQSTRGCSARGRGSKEVAQGEHRDDAVEGEDVVEQGEDGRVQTMAGISSQLAKFGVAKKKDLKSTTSTHPDISGPHISFPYSTRRVLEWHRRYGGDQYGVDRS